MTGRDEIVGGEETQGEESGRCLCGAVELRLSGAPHYVSYCHCETCRRATGGPVSVFVGYDVAQVAYPKQQPKSFRSSPGIDRPFCPACGCRIGYSDAALPGRFYVHLGVLDHPERFRPETHGWEAERVAWLHIDDALPRYDGTTVPREDADLKRCG